MTCSLSGRSAGSRAVQFEPWMCSSLQGLYLVAQSTERRPGARSSTHHHRLDSLRTLCCSRHRDHLHLRLSKQRDALTRVFVDLFVLLCAHHHRDGGGRLPSQKIKSGLLPEFQVCTALVAQLRICVTVERRPQLGPIGCAGRRARFQVVFLGNLTFLVVNTRQRKRCAAKKKRCARPTGLVKNLFDSGAREK